MSKKPKEPLPESVDEKQDPPDEEQSNESALQPPLRRLTVNVEQGSFDQEGPATSLTPDSSQPEEYLKKFDTFKGSRVPNLPNLNLPEKIILAIDRAGDFRYTPFVFGEERCDPFAMLKKVVSKFVLLKSIISDKHEFAIVQLNENSASWIQDFTNDTTVLLRTLDKLKPCDVEDTLELESLFKNVLSKVEIPSTDTSYECLPEYIIRTILFYARSYTIPNLNHDLHIRELLDHPYFILDILMTHEPLDRSNHSEKIFDVLQSMEKKGYGYFLPVARDENRIHLCMAKLLAHPLQRSLQER